MDYLAAPLTLLLLGILLFAARMINDLMTPYKLTVQLTEKDNPALSVSVAGYLVGVAIIFVGSLIGPEGESLSADLLSTAGYSLLGILLLNLSRIINDKAILFKFDNTKEIIEDRNIGTGAAQAGSYLASAALIAASIQGEGGGVHTLLAYYAIGQLALVLVTTTYNLITPFDVHEEIEKDNGAVGVSLGGYLAATGVIIAGGLAGDFLSWGDAGMTIALYTVAAAVVLPLVRLLFDLFLLPGAKLNDELSRDRNIGAALLESGTLLSFSLLTLFVL